MFTAQSENIAATELLVAMLAKTAHLEVITYEQLSAAAHMDIKVRRHLLRAACRRLQQDHSMIFDNVRTVGIKRMDDVGITHVVSRDFKRVGRAAGRAVKKGNHVNLEKLAQPVRSRFMAVLAGHTLIHHLTNEKSLRKLEPVAAKTPNILPVQKTLEAFM